MASPAKCLALESDHESMLLKKPPDTNSIEQKSMNKPFGAINVGAKMSKTHSKSMTCTENTTLNPDGLKEYKPLCQMQKETLTKTKQVSKPGYSDRAKSTILKIHFYERTKKEEIQTFLCDNFVSFVNQTNYVSEDHDMVTSISIQFESTSVAIKVLEELKNGPTAHLVEHVYMDDTEDDNGLVYACNRDIKLLQIKIEQAHKGYDIKYEDLLAKLQQLNSKKKFIPLEEYEKKAQEREVLELKKCECQKQRQEFDKYVQPQLDRLSSPMQEPLLIKTKKIISCECTRLSMALPIYSRRSEIVETICSSHVTVLVGETGSGKSTQVIQYLYEAGVADHGLIVCTQPRKVAAISLAKHVSSEMQVKLGEELGYRVGMNERCSEKTKIYFMTDHMLLNECIVDHTLSKYSCVLIDEAHERSINTDMLLAFLKKCLPFRQDLKVVIMSATIEPELFVRYFQDSEQGNKTVSTIVVSGRTFPVEVVYDPLQSKLSISSDENYVIDAINITKKIHTENPPGDILVFLTCAPEIEKACRAMEHLSHEATILALHGKLPPEEQQKVFEISNNKRKIIFSTNVAETSVTIPGVKYVVDTGLAKEMHFDTKKSMDSLEVQLISKSSAEQRKGRAGRVSSGKCYRLYTFEDYTSKMPDRAKPEILRIQLSQVVLKMLEFGVSNVLTFDFVEHPDRIALEAAVETLKFVGAIHENSLTETGKKMAALPLKPQLSKVLLDGIERGVGTEALLSVALSSLSGQVFYRGGTDETKQGSDKKKLTFCHPMGDQMTSLSVYQCWQAQEKDKRTKWCIDNYVNAKSMRLVEEMVKELGHILKKNLNLNVQLTLQSLEAADCYLCKLYFNAFLPNLAVFLGHEQAGYLTTTAVPATNISSYVIFPGSSMKQQNCTPKYVIYEKTLKTSRQFLTQVMCVKQEWVDEAVKVGTLAKDPVETYADLLLSPLHVIATGPQSYHELVKMKKELVERVQLNISYDSISPVLDFSAAPKQWGVIRALAQKKCHGAVKLTITQSARELQEKFKEETKEFGLTNERDWTRIVIGVGGTLQQVIMPYQFRTLTAVCSERELFDEIKLQLQNYGEVKETKKLSANLRFSVTYNTTESAQRALTEFSHPCVALYPCNGQNFTLQLQWERRERASHAFLSFDSPRDCQSIMQSFLYRGVKVSPDKHGDPNKLFMSGNILCHCDEDNLRKYIHRNLCRGVDFTLKMGYKKFVNKEPCLQHAGDEIESDSDCSHDDVFDMNMGHSSQEHYQSYMESKINHVINRYAKDGTYTVKFIIPQHWHTHFKAYVTFDDPEKGYKVLHSDLSKEYIDEKSLNVEQYLKRILVFRKEIYALVHEDIKVTQKNLHLCYPKMFIKLIPPDSKNKDFARISISSNDMRALSLALNMFHEATKPCVLQCNTIELQEYVLSRTCCEELRKIQTSTSTYVCRDLNTMSIKLYGSDNNQKGAVDMIEEKANELFSGGATITEVSLCDSGKPPGLMKCLVTRYGFELDTMLEFDGVRRICLNPRLQVISVLATTKGLDCVKACIDELSLSLPQTNVVKQGSEYKFDCSACFTLIEDPKDLIRLECCGHPFHIECIAIQLKPGTLTLPVQCAQDGCSMKFVLKDFYNMQKQCPSKFKIAGLVPIALQTYLETNGDTYKNCPTSDCKMIYIITDDGREFVCSSCSVSTCTKCHEEYHRGVSCEMYKFTKKSDDELRQWISEDPENRKMCPKCCIPIEKNGGCMHMACKCSTHICWKCMECFQTENGCYNHQSYCLAHTPPPTPPPVNPVAVARPRNIPVRNPTTTNNGEQNSSCIIL